MKIIALNRPLLQHLMKPPARRSILLVCAILLALPLMAKNEKKKPTRPQTQQEDITIDGPDEKGEKGGKDDASDKKAEPKLTRRTMTAEIGLCDGRTMKGKVQIEMPDSIVFVHVVDGLEFQKKVRPGDIRSIEFDRWAPVEMEQRKNGRIFRFDVTRFRVELAHAALLTVEKPLPGYLGRLTFSNKNGNVFLYSYWMDLLKPDNTWYTGIQGPNTGDRTFCHKDVLKKITFVNK